MRRLGFSLLAGLALPGLAPAARAQLVAAGPWSGAVTSDSAVVVARLSTPRFATLEVSPDPYFARPTSFGEMSGRPGDQPEISRFRALGLRPDTKYYYRIRAGEVREAVRTGSFTTFPAEGRAASFRFAFSAGATAGSNHAVFAEIRSRAPLFYLGAGNLHDASGGSTERAAYRAPYEQVLGSVMQGDLYRNVPLAYVWDSLDYGLAGSTAAWRAAAHASYREYVPHYPLASEPLADGPIAQAFTVGRVRFLLLDVRSERDPEGATLLGVWQTDWLKRELLAAKGRFPLVFVVSPSSWISAAAAGRDDWGRYAAERAQLSDWMVAQGIAGVCFLGGDASVLAADDGSHNRYAAAAGPGFPVLMAGPIDRSWAIGAGPWSAGPVVPAEGEGLFGLVEVADAGDAITVTFQGFNQHGHEKLRFSFRVPAG